MPVPQHISARAPVARFGASPRTAGTPQYPWLDGDVLYASALNAAIAGAASASNLRDFGAKSDGVTDDSPALNAAIAAVCAAPPGGKIILPAGRTVIGSAISANIPAGVALTIEGMGSGASQLYFSAATNGLSFKLLHSGSAWGSANLEKFAVIRGPVSPVAANTGVNIYADPTANAQCGYGGSFRDLFIAGNAARTSQWQSSLILNGAGGCNIDNLTLLGINAAGARANDQGDALLTITGPSSSMYAANNNIVNCSLVGGSVGLLINGYVQGVAAANTTIVGQYDGVRWTGTASTYSEELDLVNCSLQTGHRGVYTTLVAQCSVLGCTLLHFNTGVAAGFVGIEFNQSYLCNITGCNVVGAATGTETGIMISDAAGFANTIVGNTTTNLNGLGIQLKGTTANCTVVGNIATAGSGIEADTPGNTIVGNMWNGNAVAFFPIITFANGLVSNAAVNLVAGLILEGSAGSNLIWWNNNGVGPPAFGTGSGSATPSVGAKLTIYPTLTSSQVDFGIGYATNQLWMSVAQNVATENFGWYGGTTQVATLTGTGALSVAKGVGVFGAAAPTTKPSFTGAKGSNAALASVIAVLAAAGFATDSTTA